MMNQGSPHILVVDDHSEIRDLLKRFLEQHGMRVSCARDGKEMKRLLDEREFDLLVLDLMMPGEDGLTLCRELRVKSRLPIIMLTAMGEETDRIIGLEMGADDYLAKPFNPRELLARIQAMVRRQRLLGAHTGPRQTGGRIDFGAFTLWLDERRLERHGGEDGDGAQDVPLTTGEFALLQALAQQPHRPLGRDRLIALAYGPDHTATDRSIDVQVMRLRKLIEADPAQPRHIRTVWGVGYVFVPDGAAPGGGGKP